MKPLLNTLTMLAIMMGINYTSHANLNGSDDFNDNFKDTAKWGIDAGDGGVLTETNQRLEFTKAGTADAFMGRPWILNAGSYVDDWELRLDIHVSIVAVPSIGDDLRFILSVESGDNSAEINLETANESGNVVRRFDAHSEGPGGGESHFSTSTTDGAVRMTFDAATKELRYWYDDNGATGGYLWTLLHTTDLDAPATNWALNNNSTFNVTLGGESEGVVVNSGDTYADNFVATPEPTTLSLLLLGTMSVLQRRKGRCMTVVGKL